MNRFPIENIDKVRNAILADIAYSASKLSSSKNISLSGDVSGSVSFDGSSDSSITATIKDDSHNHVISNIDNLQSTIDTINTALASKGIKLSVNGKTVSLLDSNDNILSSVDTQDTNTTYNVATTSANGLMASTDKTNLNSAIKSITRSGTTFTFTRVDGTTGTFTQQDNNTTYSQATASTLGLVKLYTSTGSSTDGTMTRAAITSALSSASSYPQVAMAHYNKWYLNCTRCKSDGTSSTTGSATYVKLPSGGTWYYIIFHIVAVKIGSCNGGSILSLLRENEDSTDNLSMIAIRIA